MKTVSLLEFRQNAGKILAQVGKGQRLILTRRGKPVARLEPVSDDTPPGDDDPFWSLCGVASGKSITNSEIDKIVYGL